MQKEPKKSIANKEIVIGGISSREKLLLIQQLYAGVKAGYSIADVLYLATSQAKGRMKKILQEVSDMVNNGAYLFEAFGRYPKYFSPLFINLIKTGELSSSLEGSLHELLSTMKNQMEFNRKLRSALTYPTFVFIAILGLGLSVSFFVLPNLLPLFKSLNQDLPKSTDALLWFATMFEMHGRLIFWSLIVAVFFVYWLVKQHFSQPVTHWLFLRTPLFGSLYKKVMLARLSRAMNALLKSGITIDQSVDLTGELLKNFYYRQAMKAILPLIAKGHTLSDAMEPYAGLFESLFIKMLRIGEKTGSLEQAFFNIADYYERDVDHQTKNLMVSLEPILLIIVGLLVGFVAISILAPIYSISGSIGR